MKKVLFLGMVFGFATGVWSAPPGDAPADGACGAVNVLNSAPVKIPCQTLVLGTVVNSCLVVNRGPNIIYCNFGAADGGAYLLDAGLSTSVNWGLPIDASGGNWTFDMRMQATSKEKTPKVIWCQAKTADQVTGEANTRVCGVR